MPISDNVCVFVGYLPLACILWLVPYLGRERKKEGTKGPYHWQNIETNCPNIILVIFSWKSLQQMARMSNTKDIKVFGRKRHSFLNGQMRLYLCVLLNWTLVVPIARQCIVVVMLFFKSWNVKKTNMQKHIYLPLSSIFNS